MTFTGRIYKIVNSKTDDVYYGSTVKTLEDRFKNHINTSKSSLIPMAKFMAEIGTEHFEINLVEEVEVEDRKELLLLEKYYIMAAREKGEKLINKNLPIVTKEEKRLRNKKYREARKNDEDFISTRRKCCKKYYVENKDKIVEIARNKYQNDIEFRERSLAKTRKYYREHKDEINRKKKESLHNNEEARKKRNEAFRRCIERKRESGKITCECGSKIYLDSLPAHKKTKKHMNFIST